MHIRGHVPANFQEIVDMHIIKTELLSGSSI